MKQQLIREICTLMNHHLNKKQADILEHTLETIFDKAAVFHSEPNEPVLTDQQQNLKLIDLFLAAKRIEGCSENTIKYYRNTLLCMVHYLDKSIHSIETNVCL